MPVKIMRTLRDISSDVSRESLSTQPLLTDDYTYGNLHDTEDRIEDKFDDEMEAVDELTEDQIRDNADLRDGERPEKEQSRDIWADGDDVDCGCKK